ncbi:MAG: hypothetical protein WKF84_28950 [Pyrinomonadaceae bacterium]
MFSTSHRRASGAQKVARLLQRSVQVSSMSRVEDAARQILLAPLAERMETNTLDARRCTSGYALGAAFSCKPTKFLIAL